MDSARVELKGEVEKLRNAKKIASSPNATDKDKADLKLIEQEVQAQKLALKREPSTSVAVVAGPDSVKKQLDRKLDAALKESFPGSDPVSFVQAAPVKVEDESLISVKGGTNKM